MRILPIIALLLLAGCTTAGNAPVDEAGVSAAVTSALAVLQTGIDREDPLLASQPVSDRFVMGGNIAVRYSDNPWPDGGIGRAQFRGFFNASFEVNANVEQVFQLASLDLRGEVAIAEVTATYNALRIDRTPAENTTFSGTDYMVFELEDGAWRLVRWDEVAPPEPPAEDPG